MTSPLRWQTSERQTGLHDLHACTWCIPDKTWACLHSCTGISCTTCQLLINRLSADTSALALGRKHLIVGTAAVSVGEDCNNQKTSQFPASAAVIANMAVDQRYRKQGIAKLLLQACEEHALAAGTEYISLVVHKKNIPACELYQSSGFREFPPARPAGLSGLLSFGSGAEHIVMAKRVGQEA